MPRRLRPDLGDGRPRRSPLPLAICWHCGGPAGESTLVLEPSDGDSWRRPVCRPCLIDFGMLDADTAVEDEIAELVQLLAELAPA